LQAFATAAIGRSVRPVHQRERTNVPLPRRSVAPAKAGRGTRESPGSHPVDGWRRESACAQDTGSTLLWRRSGACSEARRPTQRTKAVWRDEERGGALARDEPVAVHCYIKASRYRGAANLDEFGSFCTRMGTRGAPRRSRLSDRRRVLRHPLLRRE
jgi:hypothetical protein